MDPDFIRWMAQQEYNIMPYGPMFFIGCVVAMLLYVEIDLSYFGIAWPRFWRLLIGALACIAVLPLSSYF